MKRKILVLTLLLAALAALIPGCGGGGGGSHSTGRMTLTVIWPEQKARLVPIAAKSIKAVLTNDAAQPLGERLIVGGDGPPAGESTVTFDNLSPGQVTLSATAFPGADGTGVAQATGAVPATIVSGQTTRVTVTMASTIERLEITPENPSIAVGEKVRLTVTPRDAAGNVVLVHSSQFLWVNANASIATLINEGGQVNEATGAAVGTAQLTVSETESGKSASTTVTVTTSSGGGCTPGPVTGPGGYPANAPWPKALHDNQNTNRGGAGGATGVLKWIVNTGVNSTIGSTAAVIGPDGTVYAGNRFSRSIFALNPADGTNLRELQQLGSNPTLGANGLIYASNSSGLFAVDLQSGTTRWSLPNQTGIGPAIIGADGTVYVYAFVRNAQGTFINTVLALDGATGAQKWAVPSENGAGAMALGADGTVYALSPGAGLNAIEGRCGTIRWTFAPVGGGVVSTGASVGADGTIYVLADKPGNTSAHMYAIDPTSGIEKWQISVGSKFGPPSIGADGTLYLAYSGVLTAHDPANGAVKWSFTATGPDPSSFHQPAIASDGTVYFSARTIESGNSISRLYAIDGATGAEKWRFPVPGPRPFVSTQFVGPVIGPDGTVYLSDDDNGTLVAVK